VLPDDLMLSTITGLSPARGETHLWLSHTPGGTPVVEDRIEILCRQFARLNQLAIYFPGRFELA